MFINVFDHLLILILILLIPPVGYHFIMWKQGGKGMEYYGVDCMMRRTGGVQFVGLITCLGGKSNSTTFACINK